MNEVRGSAPCSSCGEDECVCCETLCMVERIGACGV